MDQAHFNISFLYEIIPASLQTHLCAQIEMITKDTCLVHHVKRIDTTEPSLLPLLKLVHVDGTWVHTNSGKESNISRAIGKAIELHLKQATKSHDEMKDV